MKDQVLLPKSGLYKADLHCHTTVSDGRLTPLEIKELYMSEGYSIVAYTDHREYVWHKELDRFDLSMSAPEGYRILLELPAEYSSGKMTVNGEEQEFRRRLECGNVLDISIRC